MLDIRLPEGQKLNCVLVFLQGALEHQVKETRSAPLAFAYQWSKERSPTDQPRACQQLLKAKAEAYKAYLKYVAAFEKKYPDGYLMYKKVEWRFGSELEQNLSTYMKDLQVKDVPAEF